jgi:hypothetical protein
MQKLSRSTLRQCVAEAREKFIALNYMETETQSEMQLSNRLLLRFITCSLHTLLKILPL